MLLTVFEAVQFLKNCIMLRDSRAPEDGVIVHWESKGIPMADGNIDVPGLDDFVCIYSDGHDLEQSDFKDADARLIFKQLLTKT